MASPLRFRKSDQRWTASRAERDIFDPLDANLGAQQTTPRFEPTGNWNIRRYDVDNGDLALFAWDDDHGYWLGNTETPESLWRTEKYGWRGVPHQIARWAQREFLAELLDEDPWLEPYDHLAWYFLPVFMSKDGRETTRAFFHDHASGFPDADSDDALAFYNDFLSTGRLDEYRETMAGKLGTSEAFDRVRMTAAMGEFNAAKLLTDAGYAPTPEIELDSGYALDFRVTTDRGPVLVEVTRPGRPAGRSAGTPAAAIRQTGAAKTDDQLAAHPDAVLFIDCSSFHDDEWAALAGEHSGVGHRPAVVFRARPDGSVAGYEKGSVPLALDGVLGR